MTLIDKGGLATDVVVRDVTPETVHTDARAYARLGWIIVVVGFVGFLLWGFFAPLDKGVPLMGSVAKESNRKAVQHLTGGTIDEILVKEGETVKAGQVLVRMNAVQNQAAADVTMAQYFGARAAEARLSAERDGKASIAFPVELKPYKDDPRVIEAMATQNQLFMSRRLALQSELAALDESVAGIKLQLQGMQASRDALKEQLAIVKEQLVNLRDLAKDGYVARSRLLEMERMYAQINGQLAEVVGSIGRSSRQISELNLKRSQRIQDDQREVRAQLADVQKESEALGSRLKAEEHALANIEVKSPADGVVLGMNVFTKGGVVAPGFKLMDIVPTADALIVEGQLPVHLVDKVHPGLPVDLIFSAFNVNSTPHIAGEVTTVAADRLVDEKSGQPYYKVMARVKPEGLKDIQRLKLEVRPGMPVDMFVKTGERTMMNYLFRPIVDRMKSAMKEE